MEKPASKKNFVRIIKTEEKGSDVNLAVHLLNDAWMNSYDCAVIISNDSDLYEAINLVKKKHSKKIGLLLPPDCRPSKKLISITDFVKRIRKTTLSSCLLPSPIPGTNIYKPERW